MANSVVRINFNPVTGASNAVSVTYDNDTSGLLATNVQEAIDELDVNIDNEVTRATGAETTLQTNIDSEASTRASADTTLQTNITNEATIRANADTALQTDINTRALQTDLTSEIARATAAESTLQDNIDNHVNDTTGVHNASAITNTPSGNVAATDVQAAIDELQTDVDTRALDSDLITEIADRAAADTALQTSIDDHINDGVDAHVAESISYDDTFSTLTGVITVQGALDALDAKIESVIPLTDIPETSFDFANNQTVPADVTGFVLDPFAPVGACKAIVSVRTEYGGFLVAAEQVDMSIFNTGSEFIMSYSTLGTATGVEFSITPTGQIQYTSTDLTDSTSRQIRFRTFGLSL